MNPVDPAVREIAGWVFGILTGILVVSAFWYAIIWWTRELRVRRHRSNERRRIRRHRSYERRQRS